MNVRESANEGIFKTLLHLLDMFIGEWNKKNYWLSKKKIKIDVPLLFKSKTTALSFFYVKYIRENKTDIEIKTCHLLK